MNEKLEVTENEALRKTAVIASADADFKLLKMIDFVFFLRNRTTSELVRDLPKNFQNPVWKGNKDEAVKDFLAIDAIQWKLTGEYAKFCRTELHKRLFDETDETHCLFKGFKLSKKDNSVYNDDYSINLDTLECLQYIDDAGCLDFQIVGHTVGQLAEIASGIPLTKVAVKQIFGHWL